MVPEKRDAEARVGANEDVLHLVQVNRVELLPACPAEAVVVQGGTCLLGASHSNVLNLLDAVHVTHSPTPRSKKRPGQANRPFSNLANNTNLSSSCVVACEAISLGGCASALEIPWRTLGVGRGWPERGWGP